MSDPFMDIRVHPAAAVFPMLSDDELRDLAADIKANGLLHPIVLDADGTLIDGRNRLAACNLAGVQPTYETFEGDPLMYIISANINRREMSAGQKAMALADMLSFHKCEKYGELGGIARAGGISPQDLSYARTVREFPDLADQVRARASLRDAHAVAVDRKRQRKAREDDAQKQLTYLREEQRKAIERLEAARREIGPPVTVPPEPEMSVIFTRDAGGDVATPQPERGLGPNLEDEQRLLKKLSALKAEISAVTDEPVIEDAWFAEGHVLAVRSWASQVVSMVYGFVERHNAALEGAREIRRVK